MIVVKEEDQNRSARERHILPFAPLSPFTDLNYATLNWLQEVPSCNNKLELKTRSDNIVPPATVTNVDFISTMKDWKGLFKLPYTTGKKHSQIIHKLGNTLILDSAKENLRDTLGDVNRLEALGAIHLNDTRPLSYESVSPSRRRGDRYVDKS